MRFARPFTVLSLLLLPIPAQPDRDKMVVATRHVVHSDAIGEDRKVWVHLPRRYESSEDRYPVLFLLDGDAHMLHTAGTAQFLARNELMPELIIVGITNTDRMRDMTPTVDKSVPMPTQGGTGNFLKFICDELTPWVDDNYRTRPVRLMIGHSLGGLVALHALRTRSDFFSGLIAISPSLQWDDQHEAAQIEAWLATDPTVDSALYMTAANENGLVGACYRTAGLFDVSPPQGLRWKFHHMSQETHGSVPHLSTRDGFLFLFEDWQLEDAADAALAGTWDAAVARVARARSRYRYDYEPGYDPILNAIFMMVERNEAAAAKKFLGESGLAELGLPPELAAMFAGRALEEAVDGEKPRDETRDELTVAFYRMAIDANPWQANARAALEKRGLKIAPAVEHELDPDHLASYAGDYLCPEEKISVQLDDGHLVYSKDDGEPMRLFCKAPGEFWSATGKRLVFREASAGAGHEIVYTGRGDPRVFTADPSR